MTSYADLHASNTLHILSVVCLLIISPDTVSVDDWSCGPTLSTLCTSNNKIYKYSYY